MIRSHPLRYRTRRRLIWLATLLLLWQQMVVAGSVSPSPVLVAVAHVVMSATDGMGRMPLPAHDQPCVNHCAQGTSAQPEMRALIMPASMLPALPPLSPVGYPLVGSEARLAAIDLLPADTPPFRLRFCTLLI